MEFIETTGGRKIAVDKVGTGAPLVIVHGGWIDRSTWSRLLPILVGHFTVYAIDRPGHGDSDPYPENATMDDEAQAVADVVNSIRQPVYLVGHSSGALVALHAALRTNQIQKLALYEPPIPGRISEGTREQLEAARAAGDREQLAWLAIAGVIGDTTGERPPLEALKQSPIWSMLYRNALSVPAEAHITDSYHFNPEDFRAFRIPTALFLGTKSQGGYIEECVQTIHNALPASVVTLLEGQGHGAAFAAPQLLADKLLAFWNG